MQVLPYASYCCYLGRFLRSACAAVGMTDVFALVVTNSNVPRMALRPMAADCRRYSAWYHSPPQVVFGTYMAADCRRYIAWYHPPSQVIFGTWRAASSRPYWRNTIHPHRLYIPRGGRQIAAPTSMYHVFHILRTQNRHRMRQYTSDSLQNCQLSIVNCPLSIGTSLPVMFPYSSSNAPV